MKRPNIRRGLALVAAVCTLIGINGLGGLDRPAAAQEARRNVAYRRAVTHSSAADYDHTGHLVTDGIVSSTAAWHITPSAQYDDSPSGEGVANLFDGSTDTKWLTFHDTAYVQVAFPEGEQFAAASYVLAAANDDPNRDPAAWTLQGSQDGETFETIDTQKNQAFTERYQKKTYAIAADKRTAYNVYRLKITRNGSDHRTQLSEWDLLDADGKSLLRPFGERFDSVWISGAAGEQWLTVDLGGASRIDGVKLTWANENYAAAYQVQVSADGKDWRTVAEQKSGRGGEESLSFSEAEATFVRLLFTKAVSENYQLSEWEVFGQNDVAYTLPAQPEADADGTLHLTGGHWRVQRASEVTADGAALSATFDDAAWLPATVPGTVLTSYRRAGAIVDPNVADNQLQISDSFFTADFWYRNTFTIPETQRGRRTWLNFDAINWKADVYLNGVLLGDIQGAFQRGRFDITDVARYGEENQLAVYIHKNDHPGRVTEQTLQSAGPNGGVLGADNPTIHASIGWDWVPTIRGRNIGIYGDVYLDFTDDVRVQNAWVLTDLDVKNRDFSKAELTVKGELYNPTDHAVTATVSGRIDDTDLAFTSEPVTLAAGETREVTMATLTMNAPKLWWPNTYGEQNLYTLRLTATADGRQSEKQSITFGVRKFTYTQSGRLQIYCNGTRIVCTGGNWGMDDSNLACTAEDYDTKVRLHAEANFTMIRNWVGMTGNRAFYEACDKYGILIWDDFWLANPGDGPNPNDEDLFMRNATDKVKRNRYHAALALYCGRNEGEPPETLDAALRALTKSADGSRVYISHSASGLVSGFGPYAVQNPKWYFQNTPQTLHSERGMPNIPEYESLLAMLGEEHAWPIDSVWGLHDFCTDSAQGLSAFTAAMDKYGSYNSLKEFAKTAQMVNYENHKAMFEAVHAANTNGLLMWMSQSAWPSMVWQTYDYYYETNAGYYAIKQANQPVNAIWNSANGQIRLSNATTAELENARVVLKIYGLDGKLLYTDEQVVSAAAGKTVTAMKVPSLSDKSAVQFIETFVYDADGQEYSRNFYWRNAAKYQDYTALSTLAAVQPQASYRLIKSEDGRRFYELTVRNASETPLLMLRIKTTETATGERVLPAFYSENYLSLMPGESRTVTLEFAESALNGGEPVFAMEGWNTAEEIITAITPDKEPEDPVKMGDVNRDGAIDTADAVLVLQKAAKLIDDNALDMKAADVNGDGTIDTADAVLILQKAAKLIDEFPTQT